MIPTSYVWFSCARHFRLLILSVASVIENAGSCAPLYIAQDASDRFCEAEAAFLSSLSPRVRVLSDPALFHLGMSGIEQCHRLSQIHRFVSSDSGSLYTTKIDSDCLLFGDTVTRILEADRFALVGVWAEWGTWGAYCSYNRRVWDSLGAMPIARYRSLVQSSRDRDSLDEDHVHPRIVREIWGSDSVLLRRPDWTSGWLDAYQFGQQQARDTINPYEVRKKVDFFDVVEFGRRFQMKHLGLATDAEQTAVQESCMRQALELHRSESARSFWSRHAAHVAR